MNASARSGGHFDDPRGRKSMGLAMHGIGRVSVGRRAKTNKIFPCFRIHPVFDVLDAMPTLDFEILQMGLRDVFRAHARHVMDVHVLVA
jgi:hypothetical protein